MAARAKPQGAAKGKGAKAGANAPSAEEIQEFFDKVHSATDDMEEANAGTRGEIGRIWDKAADKLDMTKSALQMAFRKQRRDRKDQVKASRMDSRERDSLQKCAQAYGDDSPMGHWLSDMAKLAGQQEKA